MPILFQNAQTFISVVWFILFLRIHGPIPVTSSTCYYWYQYLNEYHLCFYLLMKILLNFSHIFSDINILINKPFQELIELSPLLLVFISLLLISTKLLFLCKFYNNATEIEWLHWPCNNTHHHEILKADSHQSFFMWDPEQVGI